MTCLIEKGLKCFAGSHIRGARQERCIIAQASVLTAKETEASSQDCRPLRRRLGAVGDELETAADLEAVAVQAANVAREAASEVVSVVTLGTSCQIASTVGFTEVTYGTHDQPSDSIALTDLCSPIVANVSTALKTCAIARSATASEMRRLHLYQAIHTYV